MRAKELVIKNFKNISELTIPFKGDHTYIIGKNGAGKSSALDAFFVGMKGKTALPKNNRWKMVKDGANKAVIIVTLEDETREIEIIRSITEKGVYLTINSSDGEKLGQDYLNKLLNEVSINPKGFAELDPKAQAVMLGIDTSEHDSKIKVIREERTEVGREVKTLQGAVDNAGEVEEVKAVSVASLLTEKTELEGFNGIQDKWRDLIDGERKAIAEKEDGIQKSLEYIMELKKEIEMRKDVIENAQQPQEHKSLDDINGRIENVEATNLKAYEYVNNLKDKESLRESKVKYDGLTEDIDKEENVKTEFVKAFDLPFDNMSIDEAGGLQISGRPFSKHYFSTSETWKIATQLLISMEPELKVVFVGEANLLDEDSMKKLLALSEKGYHFVFEMVGEKALDANSIVLREQEMVLSTD